MCRQFESILIAALLLLIGQSSILTAQDTKTKPSAGAAPTVTRADLGWAYLRLERSYFENLPTDTQRVTEINQAFDAATRNFFSGKYAETIAEINQLTASLITEQPSAALTAAMALKPTINPPVASLDKPAVIRIQLSSMFPVSLPTGTSLQLSLRPVAGGEMVVSKPIPIEDSNADNINTIVEIEPGAALIAGAYSLVVSSGPQPGVAIGQLNIVPRSLDLIRQENEVRLQSISAQQPDLGPAIAACRSRNALLQDQPSSGDSSQFLTDLNELAGQVKSEIDQIASGNDPYRRRSGDYWRTITADDKDKPVPYRVYAAPAVVGDRPVPLVIALHGAGGDENMFFSGYGAGMIKQLADQHGFIVASPATTAISGRTERLDALIDEMSADYAIDADAIYLIGHSMGGFATMTLASQRSDKIAAACCLAGGGNPGTTKLPPTLIIAGELDAIVPNGFLKLSAQQAMDAGLPVKFQLTEHYGHTLMVGAVLPEAVQWLLEHRQQDPGTN